MLPLPLSPVVQPWLLSLMYAISELKHKVYHPCCSTPASRSFKKVDYCVQATSNYCKTSEKLQQYMGNLSIFSSLSGFCYKWVANCRIPYRNMSHQLRHPSQTGKQYGFANEKVLYLDMSWCSWNALCGLSNEEFSVKNQFQAVLVLFVERRCTQLPGGVSHTALGWAVRGTGHLLISLF